MKTKQSALLAVSFLLIMTASLHAQAPGVGETGGSGEVENCFVFKDEANCTNVIDIMLRGGPGRVGPPAPNDCQGCQPFSGSAFCRGHDDGMSMIVPDAAKEITFIIARPESGPIPSARPGSKKLWVILNQEADTCGTEGPCVLECELLENIPPGGETLDSSWVCKTDPLNTEDYRPPLYDLDHRPEHSCWGEPF